MCMYKDFYISLVADIMRKNRCSNGNVRAVATHTCQLYLDPALTVPQHDQIFYINAIGCHSPHKQCLSTMLKSRFKYATPGETGLDWLGMVYRQRLVSFKNGQFAVDRVTFPFPFPVASTVILFPMFWYV